jgi:hypothetical protein
VASRRGRLDAATVRAALRVPAVLARFGEEYRDRPEIRLAVCPACGQRQRRALVVIDRESGPRWVPRQAWISRSQTLSVRSSDADTTCPPSGVTAHAFNASVWPSSVASARPVANSQILSVWSQDAEGLCPKTPSRDRLLRQPRDF